MILSVIVILGLLPHLHLSSDDVSESSSDLLEEFSELNGGKESFKGHSIGDGGNFTTDNYSIWSNQASKVAENVSLNYEALDGKILTRCLLRTINYWNYTEGKVRIISGEEFDSVVGSPVGGFSNDIFGIQLHRQTRFSSLFNPFLLSLKYPVSKTPVTRITHSHCTLVFIYASWCKFSVAAAPYVNALARAFPQISVVAIDVDEYLQYHWNLRVFYIPKLKIFIDGHIYREFNGSEKSLDEMTDFLWKNIRLLPLGPRQLRRQDFVGPIPSQLQPRFDSRIFIAWIICLSCVAYLVGCVISYSVLIRQLISFFRRQPIFPRFLFSSHTSLASRNIVNQ